MLDFDLIDKTGAVTYSNALIDIVLHHVKGYE